MDSIHLFPDFYSFNFYFLSSTCQMQLILFSSIRPYLNISFTITSVPTPENYSCLKKYQLNQDLYSLYVCPKIVNSLYCYNYSWMLDQKQGLVTTKEFYFLNAITALSNVHRLISKAMAKLIEFQHQLAKKFYQIISQENQQQTTFNSNNL